ncbi:MAG: hypothetical protein DRI61_07990 [Chloroflexi bacterium]|nr:MAG: hypothetical protein DRI61_07990 [Chloroflexota bacterium]
MAENIFVGEYRIVHLDANDNAIADLLSMRSEQFGIENKSSGTTATFERDLQRLPKIPKINDILAEDDKLVVRVKPDEDTEVDVSDQDRYILVPVTIRNVRTNVIYPRILAYVDFTDLIDADVTLAGGKWYNWLEYVIPAQTELKLGVSMPDVRTASALSLQWDCNITT